MFVIKRDGSKEAVKFEKISKRIERQSKDLKNIDVISIAQKVIQGLYDGVTSTELDKLATETAYSMCVKHPEYDKLATRIAISALHKDTPSTFSGAMELLCNVKDTNNNPRSVISNDLIKFVRKNAAVLDSVIDYNRDYLFDYFGFKTLERSYLLKVDGKIVERPQHMWMRVACGIHYDDIDAALNTYEMLSSMKATHATPTLFNSGLVKNQLSSCFLVAMKEDSIPGIYDTLKETALISQSAGGIGLHVHNIRAKGSPIYGTGGVSNGLIPMLKNFESCARYVDQCFASNTPIKTPDGNVKISDVSEGDYVMTTDGERLVRAKHQFKKATISITTSKGKIEVTPEHLFLAIRNGKNMPNLRELISLNHIQPEWIEAGSLTKNDILLDK